MPHHQHSAEHQDPYVVDWSEFKDRLSASAHSEAAWYAQVAGELVRSQDRLALDVGCGGAGMAVALAHELGPEGRVIAVDGDPEIVDAARATLSSAGVDTGRFDALRADLDDGLTGLGPDVSGSADLVWASAALHHAGDQQRAVDTLAALLRPGGRVALAEGGLARRHLPWDVGIGEPGLEVRLEAAGNVWFRRMRDALPDSVPMPYGWPTALRRAGLVEVTTRTWVVEKPAPLRDGDLQHVLDGLRRWVDRLTETDLVSAADVATWNRLLDPDSPDWLGHRDDVFSLEARSVHVGTAPSS